MIFWASLREDELINSALGFSVDFRPSGAHGGLRERIRFEKQRRLDSTSALEINPRACSSALCIFGVGRKRINR